MDYVVVTRPRSDVTTIRKVVGRGHNHKVVTRPRSDVTTILTQIDNQLQSNGCNSS